MIEERKAELTTKLIACKQSLMDLLKDLQKIEIDKFVPANERFLLIKKIREKIDKVGVEIDNIKKEITMLHNHTLN